VVIAADTSLPQVALQVFQAGKGILGCVRVKLDKQHRAGVADQKIA
jgi:hypothetical protein